MISEQINQLIKEEVEKGINEFKSNYINTQFEKNKLYAYLGEGLVNSLKQHKAYIAGGTITSLFSNREINDVDVYFRDEDSIAGFLYDVWDNGRYIVSHTKKATQMVYNEVNLQTIHFKYFNNPEYIFNTFDFTVCMGVFDFATETFILHPEFLKHNSQRLLKFNSETAFPIVSMLRVQKYQDKGYYISKPEFIRIILTCMNLDINSYDELKEQLGGMYGINYDKLFEDMEDKEFDLQSAIDKIANITLSDDYFKEPIPVEFKDVDDILDNITTEPKKYFEVNDDKYIIGYNKLLKKVKVKPDNTIDLDANEYLKEHKFYKFVKKVNDKYYSFYDGKFEYVIGEEVAAKVSSGYGGNGKLYLFEKNGFNNQYKSNSGSVLIEVEAKPEDFIEADEGDVLVKKCTVIREVPKEEWYKWE